MANNNAGLEEKAVSHTVSTESNNSDTPGADGVNRGILTVSGVPLFLLTDYHLVFATERPPRTLGAINLISAAFNICVPWASLTATMQLGYLTGGPMTVIYGFMIMTCIFLLIVASLSELTARYPSAGGQQHWTWLMAPKGYRRELVSFTLPIVRPRTDNRYRVTQPAY